LLLGRYRDVLDRVRAEVQAVAGDRLPAPDDAPRLPLTAQAFSESLRLYPPPWLIPRTTLHDDRLPSGLTLPRGTQVFLSPYRTQRDPRFFSEPLHFDPARFAAGPTWPDGAYSPFGGGPRHCIGESVGRAQAVLILATLCRSWQFELEQEELPRPRPLLTLRPPIPLPVRVLPAEARSGSQATLGLRPSRTSRQ
jgi:cytochrome P450